MVARTLLIVGLLTGLWASPAGADLPKRSPRAQLVQVLRGGKQALVLDRQTDDYIVVKVGDLVQGFRVTDIEDDQIVLSGGGSPERLFVLPLVTAPAPPRDPSQPDRAARPGTSPALPLPPLGSPDTATSAPGTGKPAPAASEVMDPYAASTPGASPAAPIAPSPGLLDRHGAPSLPLDGDAAPTGPVTTLEPTEVRPPASGSRGPAKPPVPVVDGPVGPPPSASPAETAPATPRAKPEAVPEAAPAAKPEATIDAAAAPAPRPGEESRRLSRRELDAALSDFSAISREVQIELAPGGGVRITKLAKRSIVARAGLKVGDVVRRVAGHTIDTVDDAAAAYAAVMSSRNVLVEITRRGAPVRIRYQLVK